MSEPGRTIYLRDIERRPANCSQEELLMPVIGWLEKIKQKI